MALKGWQVERVAFKTARPLIEKLHYAHRDGQPCTIQWKYCFGLFRPDPSFPFWIHADMVGAMVYTLPSGPTAGKSYCPEAPEKVLELRRLVVINDTPKNAESFFIGRTLRWLKRCTDTKLIISYADPVQGHVGTIYKASNFKYMGRSSGGTMLEVDGKLVHGRSLTIDRPYAKILAARVKAGDDGVKIIKTEPKHLYSYKLR